MTVEQLIEKLKAFPPKMPVVIETRGDWRTLVDDLGLITLSDIEYVTIVQDDIIE
jgi:hypothetical protein